MSTYTHLDAANAVVVDRFLTSVNMKVGAYTLDNTTIGLPGSRHVRVTHTSGDTQDTEGTIILTGTDITGHVISETVTVNAPGGFVDTTKWFRTLTSAVGAGWVIDAVEATPDTIEIGYGADLCVLDGTGYLDAIIVNTTSASSIVVADASGTIATLKASIAEGHYHYGLDVTNLTIDLNGNSDVTIIHSASLPKTYA
jgi:hypothetical protein